MLMISVVQVHNIFKKNNNSLFLFQADDFVNGDPIP